MTAQVLLLRGINVGGHGKLPMADLRALLDDLGAGGAQTHVQSGNAVCPRPVDATRLADRIEAAYGFRPAILSFDAETWRALVATNPFPTDDPTSVHAFLHDGPPLDTAPMDAHLSETERLSSHLRVLWLLAPEGIGRSGFAARAERLAGRPITARNWNSVAATSAKLDRL